MANVSFDVTRSEVVLIAQIVKRGMALAKEAGSKDRDGLSATMDITACHANGCSLRLQALLDADDFNFGHDFFGIRNHLDRDTGSLTDCFLPRFHA